MLEVGQTVNEKKVITQEMVNQFADLTGDRNPLHVDPEYAARSQFGRPIVHGVFLMGVFSNLIATKLPGPGTIYLGQEIKFKKPAFVGDEINFHLTIERTRTDRPIHQIRTECTDSAGEVLATGTATVMFQEPKGQD